MALRACGVSKNVVGVSPRKLFWIISVCKLLAQGHTCSVPIWAHVMICTILAMEIDSQSQSSWRTMAGAYHRFFDFVAKYWFVTYGGSQFCMAFPFVQSILFKGNFGLSVCKDPWKVCQLIRMILETAIGVGGVVVSRAIFLINHGQRAKVPTKLANFDSWHPRKLRVSHA